MTKASIYDRLKLLLHMTNSRESFSLEDLKITPAERPRKKEIQREEVDRMTRALHAEEEKMFLAAAENWLKESGKTSPTKEDLQAAVEALRADVLEEQKPLSGRQKREVVRSAQLSFVVERLKEKLTLDELTGLLNKHGLEHAFNSEAKRYSESDRDEQVVPISIDMDGLKYINDNYGHEAGSQAIKKIANRLNELTRRRGDYASRLSGDEFGLLFTGVKEEALEAFIKKIFESFKDLTLEVKKRGQQAETIKLTVSMGATYSAGRAELNFKEMLNEADQAVLSAKESGRDRYVIAKPLAAGAEIERPTEDKFVQSYLSRHNRELNAIKNPEKRNAAEAKLIELAKIAYADKYGDVDLTKRSESE